VLLPLTFTFLKPWMSRPHILYHAELTHWYLLYFKDCVAATCEGCGADVG